MVGYRNDALAGTIQAREFIRRSDGGVSERDTQWLESYFGVYQAFRWWGIGTCRAPQTWWAVSLSGVPMVGYRNGHRRYNACQIEFIRRSDGGVSERQEWHCLGQERVYQAFRWWGIGTCVQQGSSVKPSLSGVPMVGYRNYNNTILHSSVEFIRRSDGGVSERLGRSAAFAPGVYQAFRWWGIGT